MSRQHSIVPHKANYFYRILEDDYLLLYETLAEVKEQQEKKTSGPSDCKAMIASVLENWMNSKRPSARCEEDLYVYLTYDEWESELRHRYGRSKIIHCLDEMEREGSYIDTEGKYGEPDTVYTGTIKKRHFIQNTFQYQLNLPVVIALLEALPEQSPFEQKVRPSLGRPKKYRPEKNDINKNGLNVDDRGVKIDGQSVKVNDGSVKVNAPFYTHITHTESYSSHIREESNSAHIDTDTLAPPHVGALSLPQSSDIDNHSQSLPLSSTVTTRNEEGDAHGTDNTHSSASHPHSREPGVDLTPARNGSQADNPARTAEQRSPRDSRQEQEIASQEGDTHAQPLQPLPTANHPDRGRGNVPSRDSQVNSTGFTSPLDTPPVGDTQAHSTVGGEGRAGVGEDTARGIGSGDAREADTTGDTARGQVTEGDDHAHLPAGSADRIGALPAPGGDSHDAAVDDRHVVAPEVGPVLEAGQEEEVNDGRTNSNLADMALADTGHHLPGVPDYCHKETAVEQIAPREEVPVVAASPLTTSTVEPGHGGWDAMPAAPVPGQEGVKPARSRQSKVKPIPEGPPVMPAEDAPWCAETIVQICEARRGRRYPNGAKRKSDRERDVQLEYAKQLAEMPDIDREKLLKAASHQETRHDNWWMDTNGYISPKQLVEKDRIHNMLDELMRLERKKNLKVVPQSGSTNGISKPTNEPTTNIRELVRQREAARAAQVQ